MAGRRIISLCFILAVPVVLWQGSASRLYAAEDTKDRATWQFELAYGLYTRGPTFHDQAVIQLRKFLNDYPGDQRCDLATLFLGKTLTRQGKYKEALDAFLDHQKFKGSPNRDEVNFRTGETYFSLGNHAEAIRYFLKVHTKKKVEKNLADSCAFWLGRAYLKNNQPTESIAVLTKLADDKKSPLAPWADFHLGYAYSAAGDFGRAIERFQKAEAAPPSAELKAEALFMVAECYAKLEKYERAYAGYRELVQEHAESPFRGQAAFGAVWSLYSAKKYEEAIAAYQVCEKFIPPDSQAEAAYILANCHYEAGNKLQALQTYQKVVSNFPKSDFAAPADYKACLSLFLLNRFDEVIASGRAFVKNYPRYEEIVTIHFLLGESLYERNRTDEALSEYQAVLTQGPQNPFREKASFKLGLCHLKANSFEKARETFRNFASTHPTSELAPQALARAAECGLKLAEKAKPDEQKREYEEVARDYKGLVTSYGNDTLAGEALYQLGVTYLRLDRHDDMIAAFKKLVKDYPKHDNCAEAYYWLASESEKAAATKPQAEAANEYDEAVAYFQRCIALKPKGPYADRARGRLADVYYRKGDHQNAASLILTILRSDLRSDVPPPSHLWAGEFFLESGNYDGAIEVFDLFLKKFHSASQLDPASAARLERAYFGLGDSYFRQEKWQQAIDNFAKAIALKGERLSQARLYSGIAYLKLRQNAKAVELLRIVEETAPYELVAKATYWLGNMHFDLAKAAKTQNEKIKQYAQAREKYVQVVILYKNSEVRPECMFRVAECLEQEGSVQEANQELNRLIKAYPDDEFAERARQKLGIKPAPASGQ